MFPEYVSTELEGMCSRMVEKASLQKYFFREPYWWLGPFENTYTDASK